MNDDMPWVNLTQEEVEQLRKQKHELTEYGKQKLRELMNEPIQAKVSEEDYNKVVKALTLTHEEMLEEAERRERSNTVLARYNAFYNEECSGLPHGTPITPEHMQAMALECMVDALICENLNVEYNAIAIDDIKDLIARLYQQGNEFLEQVEKFKEKLSKLKGQS
jgi:hypothetical protein